MDSHLVNLLVQIDKLNHRNRKEYFILLNHYSLLEADDNKNLIALCEKDNKAFKYLLIAISIGISKTLLLKYYMNTPISVGLGFTSYYILPCICFLVYREYKSNKELKCMQEKYEKKIKKFSMTSNILDINPDFLKFISSNPEIRALQDQLNENI